jgi:hypothetical protein
MGESAPTCLGHPFRSHLGVARSPVRPFAVIAKRGASRYHRAVGNDRGYLENSSINEPSVSASPYSGETFDSASSCLRNFIRLHRRLGSTVHLRHNQNILPIGVVAVVSKMKGRSRRYSRCQELAGR